MITCAQRSCLRPYIGLKPGLQTPVIGFEAVVGVGLGMVPGARGQFIEDPLGRPPP